MSKVPLSGDRAEGRELGRRKSGDIVGIGLGIGHTIQARIFGVDGMVLEVPSWNCLAGWIIA